MTEIDQEQSFGSQEFLNNHGIVMMHSAEEFVSLRTSDDRLMYERASTEQASVETWTEVIIRFPEMRKWVAHNKTVPLEILRVLARDADPSVRSSVADKRKLDRELFDGLSRDPDESVRARIAWNKKTPADIIERLTRDELPFVRDAAFLARQRILDSCQ